MDDDEPAEEGQYKCPVCGIDPEVDKCCEHLFCHGDELPTWDLADAARCVSLFEGIQDRDENAVPSTASEFLSKYGNRLPSFISEDHSYVQGAGPVSFNYSLVWTNNPKAFADEIRLVLESILNKLDAR